MASIKTVLEIANEKFLLGIRQAEDATKKFGKEVGTQGNNINEAFNTMGTSAAALGGTMLALGGFTAAFADDMADLATAHQTSITEVLALGKALAMNGGKMDSVGKMMQTMANQIEAANAGNVKLARNFESLGVSMSMLGTSSEKEIRDKLIKSIASIEDPATRAAKAVEVFGKAATGVDFTSLAASIESNTAKYAANEAAIKSAADAFDTMQTVMTDLKVAFAEAFKPFFDVIKNFHPEVKTLEVGLKAAAAALMVMVSAAAIAGAYKLVAAFQALRLAVVTNPIGAIATLLLAAGASFGLLASSTEAATEATKENTDAAQANADVKRDASELASALAKERESLTKITDAYLKQNETITKKLSLEMASLSQTEEQKRVSQQVADIEQGSEKALMDLRNAYNALSAGGQAANKAAYLEQQDIIKQNAEIEKKTIAEKIAGIEAYKRVMNDIQGALGIMYESEVKLMKAVNERNPRGALEQIANEEQINAVLQRRQIIIDAINKQGLNPSLKGIADNLTSAGASIDEQRKSYQAALKQYSEANRGELAGQVKDLETSIKEQMNAVDQAVRAQTKERQETLKTQRSFSYGWTKAYKDYIDDTQNMAAEAGRIFNKFTSGMEDAIYKFVKTGKLSFKDLINTMVDELLRSQIRQLVANLVGGGGGTAGGGGLSSLWTGAKKLLGFANGGVIPTNGPVVVGERGPELLVGAGGSTVIPNTGLGGSTSVTYNINAVDAQSFKAMIARDPTFIHAVAEQGRRSLPGTRR